ncbi:MAG: phospholipase D family protein, partial [Janthinobacterium lividum]
TRALVVSPFVQEDGLERIDARDRVLVSRPEELDRLDGSTLVNVDARVLNEAAWLSEGGEDNQLTGLHAKAYVIEYDRRAWNILGSPNATRPGLAGDRGSNIEFAVTVEGSKKDFGVDRWLSGDNLGHLLVAYDRQVPSASDETAAALESTLRSLAGVPFSARAVPDKESWSEHVWPEEPLHYPPTQHVGVELLTTRGRRQQLPSGSQEPVSFAALTIPEITPFLVLTVEQDGQSVSACLRATLLDDVPDRLDHVLMGQVDTADKFLRWLLMLLADDPGAGFLVPLDEDRSGGSWLMQAQQRGLFEAMVTSLAEHPEQLHLIERFVSKVLSSPGSRQVLPDGFVELWQVVRTALAQGAAA